MFRANEEAYSQNIHCLAPILSCLAALISAVVALAHAEALLDELATVEGWSDLVAYWPRLLIATLLGVVMTPVVLGLFVKFPAIPTLLAVYATAALIGASVAALLLVRTGSVFVDLWRAVWVTGGNVGVILAVTLGVRIAIKRAAAS